MAWQMQMVETFHFLDAVVRIGYIGQTSADRRQLQHILMTQLAVCEFADLHSLNAWCRGGGGRGHGARSFRNTQKVRLNENCPHYCSEARLTLGDLMPDRRKKRLGFLCITGAPGRFQSRTQFAFCGSSVNGFCRASM